MQKPSIAFSISGAIDSPFLRSDYLWRHRCLCYGDFQVETKWSCYACLRHGSSITNTSYVLITWDEEELHWMMALEVIATGNSTWKQTSWEWSVLVILVSSWCCEWSCNRETLTHPCSIYIKLTRLQLIFPLCFLRSCMHFLAASMKLLVFKEKLIWSCLGASSTFFLPTSLHVLILFNMIMNSLWFGCV